jgi:alpha-tubulin suppressor-like RCC1 family protein
VKAPGGVGTLSGIDAVATGGFHNLALTADGTVLAWGRNEAGQLGDGGAPTASPFPVQVKGVEQVGVLDGITAVAAGADHSLALGEDGTVYAWGENESGQVGNGGAPADTSAPVRVKGVGGTGVLGSIVAIAAGSDHSLALAQDGTVYAWGDNDVGALGNGGTPNDSATPVQVAGPGGIGVLGGIEDIDGGFRHSLALTSAGTVFAWGQNVEGQLGDGNSPTNASTPVQVKGVGGAGTLSSAQAIAAGNLHSVAMTADGAVYAWGWNDEGQLGDDNGGTETDTPVQVKGPGGAGVLTGVESVSAGRRHVLALASDGRVLAWGDNASGQLGEGTIGPDHDTPVSVKGIGGSGTLDSVLAVSASGGARHSLALARAASASIATPGLTSSRAIAVTVAGDGVFPINGYHVSESPVPPVASSQGWSASPPTSFGLSPGDGTKTVYAFTRDTQGFVSPAAEATVVLDSTPPVTKFSVRPYARSLLTPLSIAGTDSGGIRRYFVGTAMTTPGPADPGWSTVRPRSYVLPSGADGPRSLFAWTMDAAGNISPGRPTRSCWIDAARRSPSASHRAAPAWDP